MQKSHLLHFYVSQRLINYSTDQWDREEIKSLACRLNLSFKKTYKWLWDKKERDLQKPGNKRSLAGKPLFNIINLATVQQKIKPIFQITKVKR